jgi:hypothetical protein
MRSVLPPAAGLHAAERPHLPYRPPPYPPPGVRLPWLGIVSRSGPGVNT